MQVHAHHVQGTFQLRLSSAGRQRSYSLHTIPPEAITGRFVTFTRYVLLTTVLISFSLLFVASKCR
jgi:hypothetical protein